MMGRHLVSTCPVIVLSIITATRLSYIDIVRAWRAVQGKGNSMTGIIYIIYNKRLHKLHESFLTYPIIHVYRL